MRIILTRRMRLVTATAEIVQAAIDDRPALAKLLTARVPEDWPLTDFRDALPIFRNLLQTSPEMEDWLVWLWMQRGNAGERDVLVGEGGFVGWPDQSGTLEIGYSVLPEFRRRGLAREGVAGILPVAFARPEVQRVIARTSPQNIASIRTLERVCFCRVEDETEKDNLCYALSRAAFESIAGAPDNNKGPSRGEIR